jgi:hypothetical protein
MFDANGVLLYWLIFCTNNLRGLEEMKKAMWKVDSSGSFRFSDKDNPAQFMLLEQEYSQEWLAEELKEKLPGRELTVGQIEKYVLTRTPCYRFKEALKLLETADFPAVKVIEAPEGRRRGSFPDKGIRIRFEQSLF